MLGTRLSDHAILFGKLGAAIGYGWGLTLLSAALAVITVNVPAWSDHWLFYSSTVALGILVLRLLGAGLAAAIVLTIVDVGLMLVAAARFQRVRLTLD